MYSFRSFRLIGFGILLASCAPKEKFPQIVVTNSLNIDRAFETVELTKDFLNIENLSEVRIMDPVTKEPVISQTVDLDGDSIHDKLIFQPKIKANSKNTSSPELEVNLQGIKLLIVDDSPDYAGEVLVLGTTAREMTLLTTIADTDRIHRLRSIANPVVGRLGVWFGQWNRQVSEKAVAGPFTAKSPIDMSKCV